jgi:hypothetical protein
VPPLRRWARASGVAVSPIIHASLSLARRIDLSEIGFCAVGSRAGEPGGADTLLVGGGRAICGPLGAPFNKVLGLGLGADVSDADLDAIDEFYDAHESPAQIELCPLAVSGLPARLASRGYVIQGFENQLVLGLEDFDGGDHQSFGAATTFSIAATATTVDADAWIGAVSAGFAAGEHPADGDIFEVTPEFRDAMRGFQHPSMALYLARDGEHAVGGGASYIFDGVLGLTGTATVPAHRGRGVMHAVVRRMLHDARGRADLAMATTEPGSRSQRTFERFGFRVVYTRAILVRPFQAR